MNRPIAFIGTMIAEPAGSYGRQRIACDRCKKSISDGIFYHCLGCDDYDICASCAAIGLYCMDDNHSWAKRGFDDGELYDTDVSVSADAARSWGSTTKKYPSKFQPPQPTDTPRTLFADEHRFIRNSDPREILIYTDGSCLSNGQANPQGGCAFVYRPSAYSQQGVLTHGGTLNFRLETQGPSGMVYKQTSNRAELRAVIGALQFCDWSMDCNRSWRSLVIATDSEYVAVNATDRIQRWELADWMLASQQGKRPAPVMNQDLWRLLLDLIRQLHRKGVNIAFWRIPRSWNERADRFAKEGAQGGEVQNFHVVLLAGPTSARYEQYQRDGSC
ncbi:ribonuclease H-like protein [Stipitochalara longipes BDJ]|nr:ribonuclease H-like protein [Stipitochalara longipes BDJ]